MTITRRGFLIGMLALGAAPAIVRAASLMRTVTPAGLLVPSGDVLTTEMLRTLSRTLQQNSRDDQYYIIMHPSIEQALRELAFSGTTRIIYKREVLRHG